MTARVPLSRRPNRRPTKRGMLIRAPCQRCGSWQAEAIDKLHLPPRWPGSANPSVHRSITSSARKESECSIRERDTEEAALSRQPIAPLLRLPCCTEAGSAEHLLLDSSPELGVSALRL